MSDSIFIKGAKEHNLKNLSVRIPRNQLVVFTGLSGSGKSSLAFDTLFAEGQRRYVESLSSYARMFIGQMEKPDVEYIEGLSPAISIDQKTTNKNPRSTVGTVTEIYDYLRLLYANVGIPHCPICGKPIEETSIDQIVDALLAHDGAKLMITAPVVRGKKGEYVKQLEGYKKQGFMRVVIDGITYTFDEELPALDKQIKHDISVVIDRIKVSEGMRRRLTDSVETALKLAEGVVEAVIDDVPMLYNTLYSCPDCNVSLPEISPRLFSFNSPYGACPCCNGLGMRFEADPWLLIPDSTKSLADGAICIKGMTFDAAMIRAQLQGLAKYYGFSLTVPFKDLPDHVQRMVFYGNNGERIPVQYKSQHYKSNYNVPFEGIVNIANRRYNETQSELMKREYESFMREIPCVECVGDRLNDSAKSVTVGGLNIVQVCRLPITKALLFFDNLELTPKQAQIAFLILKEIRARLNFLINVGLGYLSLFRASATLSGGESQRIRLATQIGSGLEGVLYILDEPSIGLHQRDNGRLISALKRLRDLGNTLVVVEHDEETILSADHVVDIGPLAGIYGGELVAQGTPQEIMSCPTSLTGQYLSGQMRIPVPCMRKAPDGRYLRVMGARQHNLKGIDVQFPVGLMTAVTGVSGSGKSSLVNGVLHPHLATRLNKARANEGAYDRITGVDYFDKVINIDQSPIGRTPRSNPATYTGVFNDIRALYAQLPDAISRGYTAGRFSFNVGGGRCESCGGDGILKIEMHFLPDVYVTCDVCKGKRYNRETLEVRYKGKSIGDILDMTIEEACVFFSAIPRIYNKIKTLNEVGLGYIKLGQPATTLSGGEAQRVKLATELAKRSTGRTIYILDEPTTGLHTHDVSKLIDILQRLTIAGNTVVVIEHNLDVIKVADYIIDLGPEGGDEGGTVIVSGTPEEVAACPTSWTGKYLSTILKRGY